MLDTTRHDHIFPHTLRSRPVTIIGAGAIGSRIFEAVVNLGCKNINLYDFDTVEAHNLPNQLYTYDDLNVPKVYAAVSWALMKTGTEPGGFAGLNARDVKLPTDVPVEGCVFLCVDSFDARRQIAENHLFNNAAVTRVFECRMGARGGTVTHFDPLNPGERTRWLATLGDDASEDVERSPCGTALTVGTTASIVANFAVNEMMLLLTEPGACTSKIDIHLYPAMIGRSEL